MCWAYNTVPSFHLRNIYWLRLLHKRSLWWLLAAELGEDYLGSGRAATTDTPVQMNNSENLANCAKWKVEAGRAGTTRVKDHKEGFGALCGVSCVPNISEEWNGWVDATVGGYWGVEGVSATLPGATAPHWAASVELGGSVATPGWAGQESHRSYERCPAQPLHLQPERELAWLAVSVLVNQLDTATLLHLACLTSHYWNIAAREANSSIYSSRPGRHTGYSGINRFKPYRYYTHSDPPEENWTAFNTICTAFSICFCWWLHETFIRVYKQFANGNTSVFQQHLVRLWCFVTIFISAAPCRARSSYLSKGLISTREVHTLVAPPHGKNIFWLDGSEYLLSFAHHNKSVIYWQVIIIKYFKSWGYRVRWAGRAACVAGRRELASSCWTRGAGRRATPWPPHSATRQTRRLHALDHIGSLVQRWTLIGDGGGGGSLVWLRFCWVVGESKEWEYIMNK